MIRYFRKGDALFGFLKSVRNKHGEFVFRPVFGRIFLFLFCVAVAGWLSGALAVSLFVKYGRGFESGSYVDILFYPWRKEAYQKAWGEEFIERGLALIEEGEFSEGFRLVRIGHIKSPGNLEARLIMAEIHMARNRPDLAGTVLRDGLAYMEEDDFEYLRVTLRTLLGNEEDLLVREIVTGILEGTSETTPRNQISALAGANAAFFRGNYDDAEQFIIRYGLEDHPEGRILLARIDWERGRQDAAIERLEKLADAFTDQEEVYIYLTQFHRELGQYGKAHGYAVMRQIKNPLTASPRIALLYLSHSNGETEHARTESRRLLQEFEHDQEALLGLGEFAAHTGDVDLSRRIFQAADRNGFELDFPAILLSETHLKAGEFQEAISFLESHSLQNKKFAERFGPVLNGVYLVAHLGLGEEEWGEGYLKRLLSTTHLRAENFLITSRRVMELGGYNDFARRLIEHAHRVDPRNQAALIELVRLDLEGGWTIGTSGNIEKLLQTRKPPKRLLEESVSRMETDRFLFMPDREEVLQSIGSAIERISEQSDYTHS